MKYLKNILYLGLIAFVFYVGVSLLKPQKNKTQDLDDLIKEMTNLQKMQTHIKDVVTLHKKYLMQLRGASSQVKDLGLQVEKKIQLAKGFGRIGDAYVKEKLLPIALDNYTMGLELSPYDASLNYKKGLILANFGLYYPEKQAFYFKQALSFYKTASNIQEDFLDPHYSLALLYLSSFESKIPLGSLKEAIGEVDHYLSGNTKNNDAYFLKGKIAFLMGDKKTAIQAYQGVLNFNKEGTSEYRQAKANLMQLSGM